ncbi:FAD-binding oxidoreductase [Actinomadura madurae]|uniref:FAD-binding oxidoreductase n=1 Tax=Actinomadura madurae TaxID=1993 RepID=UPI0020274404|nr:FAD-binding oxidoreductase [Actinomadura madurae]MCP9955573.1 FAD-binding oxidoreductase [Actinomadura madurae]MCP9972312.1 FAD-binding oxidoreductase [Actinomadura madurae]URN01026.1 FAD-binding oxidoreductase [Actinomadura madurae]
MTHVTEGRPAEAALEAALARFEAIVGPEHVLRTTAALAEFRDPFQPAGWDDHTPSAVVQPETAEQVQEIVRVAAEHSVPLWPNGQGRNNGYGGAGPRLSGSVTVNFRRMNRILEIDDELCYALVEPGVSFLELDAALRDGGHPLLLSVPDIGWGSLVGNSLDHGVTYLKYGQDFMAPCGLEVVTADGELLRTGMGGVPGSRSWNLYRRGLGPSLDQLFMQSNLGIVTKMGVWLQRSPEVVMPVTVVARREDDIVELADTLRGLLLDGTVAGVPVIYNTPSAAAMVSQRSDWYDGTGPMPEEVLDRVGRELGIGRWTMRLSLWGDGPVVDHRFAKIKAAFGAIPGVEVTGRRTTPERARELEHPSDRVAAGVPGLDLVGMAGWRAGARGGHMDFAPVVPLKGAEILRFVRTFRPMVEAAGLDFKSAIMAISERSAIYVSGSNFGFDDEDQARLVYETMKKLVSEAGKRGYGNYRAHLSVMDVAAEQFSFNDHAYMRFVEKIKDAVDPAGILAPGKQGIWPASRRHRR